MKITVHACHNVNKISNVLLCNFGILIIAFVLVERHFSAKITLLGMKTFVNANSYPNAQLQNLNVRQHNGMKQIVLAYLSVRKKKYAQGSRSGTKKTVSVSAKTEEPLYVVRVLNGVMKRASV